VIAKMNRCEIMCTHKTMELSKTEKEEILQELQKARLQSELLGPEIHPQIIRKTDLKNQTHLIVELKGAIFQSRPVGLAILKVKVDSEKNELSGIRIFRNSGGYVFKKYTFYLESYRKLWRAWTKMPRQIQAWK